MNHVILAVLASTLVADAASIPQFGRENQHVLGPAKDAAESPDNDISALRCDLAHPIDPSDDGLLSSEELFSGIEALELMVQRHQPLVRIESVCYDDLGGFDEDERWKPFREVPDILKETYPMVHKHASIETINRFGLVYTIHGSDETLQPVLLTAHQDVVPVEQETLNQWEHPPFDAYYNETDGYLWGRGATDKASVTALMTAMEALLSQPEYDPRRTVIFAFGFDEECSGYRGAGRISKYLEEQYGEGGIAVILDEGGAGVQSLGDTMYALPAVYEKGYLDVWFDLDVLGGHSATPTPHTALGIMSEIVVNLESHPFEPKIERNSPVHQTLACLARYSSDLLPDLADAVYRGDLRSAAQILAQTSKETQYLIQTSQAVDFLTGGDKINSLPEYVTLGVNHRYAPQDSVGSIQHRIVQLAKNTSRRYNLEFKPFEGDEDYEAYLAAHSLTRDDDTAQGPWLPTFSGTLKVETKKRSYITPQAPTKGAVWDVFAGTVRHTFADDSPTVVVAPGAMTANTDTQHYLNLSKNIYRWSPGSLKSFGHINAVNDRLLMSEHVDMAKFYYDFIRNFDQADL